MPRRVRISDLHGSPHGMNRRFRDFAEFFDGFFQLFFCVFATPSFSRELEGRSSLVIFLLCQNMAFECHPLIPLSMRT